MESCICGSNGLDLIANIAHMILYHCPQSPRLPQHDQCTRYSYNNIVQSHPHEESPGETLHLGIAQAVLCYHAHPPRKPDSVTSYCNRLLALTLVKYCHTCSPHCTFTLTLSFLTLQHIDYSMHLPQCSNCIDLANIGPVSCQRLTSDRETANMLCTPILASWILVLPTYANIIPNYVPARL